MRDVKLFCPSIPKPIVSLVVIGAAKAVFGPPGIEIAMVKRVLKKGHLHLAWTPWFV